MAGIATITAQSKSRPAILADATCGPLFHGSDHWFENFDENLDRYEDGGLWLTTCPLLAGCYGRFVYACRISGARLQRCTASEWFEDFLVCRPEAPVDGFILTPLDASFAAETDPTFLSTAVILRRINKVRVLARFQLGAALEFEEVTAYHASRKTPCCKPRHGIPVCDEVLQREDVKALWHDTLRHFFAAKPFVFRVDPSLSIRAAVRDLLAQARARQAEVHGARHEGAMVQHLVGAKLDLVLGAGALSHHPASGSDQGEGKNRPGDFLVGDVAIHVTTHPGEALIEKCGENLKAGLRPVIVTAFGKTVVAEGLAETAGIAARVDVLDVEQFLAANLHERAFFRAENRGPKTRELIDRYNALIEAHETDPSLRIELAGA